MEKMIKEMTREGEVELIISTINEASDIDYMHELKESKFRDFIEGNLTASLTKDNNIKVYSNNLKTVVVESPADNWKIYCGRKEDIIECWIENSDTSLELHKFFCWPK